LSSPQVDQSARCPVRESSSPRVGNPLVGVSASCPVTRNPNLWNSLPNHVVLSDTVYTFKSRLDKFWQHQDVVYDFKAEIHGTGSRSCY